MSNVPDAWDDEWSSVADKPSTPPEPADSKKVSSKVTKAQKRAQQAEFNRQLWAEAEGPRQTNFFLESRNVVPHRTEFKPPTVLLSRKGPVIQQSRKPPTDALENLDLKAKEESSEDEDDIKERERSLAERQAQAAKDREERQRKYEERRQELFGTTSNPTSANNTNGRPTSRSGNSTPTSLTPPGSRSSTPNRRGRGGGGRGRGGGPVGTTQPQTQSRPQRQQQPELYDPSYAPKPESAYLQRRENVSPAAISDHVQQPIRTPKGPDGSGRGGFGFAGNRGGKQPILNTPPVPESVT